MSLPLKDVPPAVIAGRLLKYGRLRTPMGTALTSNIPIKSNKTRAFDMQNSVLI